jgi:hypothetical protein
LFLKNGAGGVHDQLWQKTPVEETEEISQTQISFVNFVSFVVGFFAGCPILAALLAARVGIF